jgi:hypothetical protein
MSLLYAATYPRPTALILFGTYAKHSWAPDCPSCGWKDERWDRFFESLERNWGTPQGSNIDMWCPSPVLDPNIVEGAASSFRTAASPGPAVAIMKMIREIDVRRSLEEAAGRGVAARL